MRKELFELGVHTEILKGLKRLDFNPAKDGVLEIHCGKGLLAAFLADNGIKKYHGITNHPEEVNAAKAALKGYSRRFHLAEPVSEEALSHKSDVIICTDGCPWSLLQSGQKLIVVNTGYANWDDACLFLTPYFAAGAKTIQFNNYFLTVGVLR